MVETDPLPTPGRFRAGEHEGLADTLEGGVGGSVGMRPHELPDASLTTWVTVLLAPRTCGVERA